jgi:nitroimidazol reductase NimA-like FMN-containing flavoprotein (pyridoxamine 5'-phosphate oxidase superfamily)
MPVRGSHDWDTISQILDSGFLAQVGFAVDGQPFVLPTLYGRSGETLYLHGSAASRMLQELGSGVPACVSVTLVDGIVLARSAFHHSMNYRSVVAFGTARKIEDPDYKVQCLEVISEHLIPGRWAEVRSPNASELKATTVAEFQMEEASSKVRSGPPVDEDSDYALAAWAGVLPLAIRSQQPIAAPELPPSIVLPEYLLRYEARLAGHKDRLDPKKITPAEKSSSPKESTGMRWLGEKE